ncbi:hypothetical protein BD769DRAFT_1677772 [Suillus cothurnatus]|nr:hypothetical protein BD769DRAFT_1677772 [Suillus cothurnatus]
MQENLVTALLKAGVNVAIGIVDEVYAQNTCFEAGWLLLTSNGFIDHATAFALVTTNLEKALGVQMEMFSSLKPKRSLQLFSTSGCQCVVVERLTPTPGDKMLKAGLLLPSALDGSVPDAQEEHLQHAVFY